MFILQRMELGILGCPSLSLGHCSVYSILVTFTDFYKYYYETPKELIFILTSLMTFFLFKCMTCRLKHVRAYVMVTTDCLEHSPFHPMFRFLKMFSSLSCHDFGSRVCSFFAFVVSVYWEKKLVKIIREEDVTRAKSIIYLRYQLKIFVKYCRL